MALNVLLTPRRLRQTPAQCLRAARLPLIRLDVDRVAVFRLVVLVRVVPARLPFRCTRSGNFAFPVSRFHSSNVSGEISPFTRSSANLRRCALLLNGIGFTFLQSPAASLRLVGTFAARRLGRRHGDTPRIQPQSNSAPDLLRQRDAVSILHLRQPLEQFVFQAEVDESLRGHRSQV